MPKLAKSEVGFEHPAKGPHHCGECRHFMPNSRACTIVAGEIASRDWCKRFESKRASNDAARAKHYQELMSKE